MINSCGVCDRPDSVFTTYVTDDDCRFRVAQEIFEFRALVAHIQWLIYESGSQAGEIQAQGFRRLFHLDGDAVPGGCTQIRQEPGKLRRPLVDVAVAVALILPGTQEFIIRMLGELPVKVSVEIEVPGAHRLFPSHSCLMEGMIKRTTTRDLRIRRRGSGDLWRSPVVILHARWRVCW